jgi:hypothetical protein
MFAYLKNCSLFQQLIIPMFAVGIIGVGAIVVSAIVLQDSVNALGDLSAAGNERLKALQEVDKDIANFRALSLKHLASESARAMADLDTELKAIESENRVKLPALCRDTQARVPEETEALRDAITRYFSGIDEAIQLSSDFEKEFAFEKLTEVEGRYLTAIQDAMQSLARHAFEDISASREDLTAAVQAQSARRPSPSASWEAACSWAWLFL